MRKYWCTVQLFFISIVSTFAQLHLPQASPKAQVSQTIGLTNVTVNYHAPSVKGREVWGKLVPFGQMWRAGANEATLITFSDSVFINGQDLPAGTYSFFILPEAENRWFLVFNKNTALWGTDGYQPSEDKLRVPVTPVALPHNETLQFVFSNIKEKEGTLHLNWEKLSIPILIEVNVIQKAINNIKEDLSKAQNNDWKLYASAANYLIQLNVEHELALQWIDQSIEIKRNYHNYWLKARLLAQKNEYQGAVNLTKKAIKLGEKDDKDFLAMREEMKRSLHEWKVKRYNNES